RQRAVDWVARRTGGDLDTLWVVEGVGTYGARLARAAADAGYSVAEAARMNARANRGVGKSDPLDACRIAQAVLPLDVAQLRRPRTDDGVRAAVRVLIASRDHISVERTPAINTLTALLRGAPAGGQIALVAAWRPREEALATRVARAEAVRLAKRVLAADQEIASNAKQMTALLNSSPARNLLDQPGSRIRQSRRREPDPGLVWKHRPPPDQPRRRPPVEPRPAHGRGNPHAHGPRHTRLRRETNRRRTHPPRDPPLPQALPCPPDLPPPQRRLRHAPGGLTTHRRFNRLGWLLPSLVPGINWIS